MHVEHDRSSYRKQALLIYGEIGFSGTALVCNPGTTCHVWPNDRINVHPVVLWGLCAVQLSVEATYILTKVKLRICSEILRTQIK